MPNEHRTSMEKESRENGPNQEPRHLRLQQQLRGSFMTFYLTTVSIIQGVVLSDLAGVIASSKALENGDTSVTSNALYLTPFLSLVYIAIFLGETILNSSIVGLVIIVFGIILQSVPLRKKVSVREE